MINNNTDYKVLIIGGVHHNTLGVIRSIGKSSFSKKNIFLLIHDCDSCKHEFLSKSKYIDRANVFLLESSQEIFFWIKNSANILNKCVVICCSDISSEIILSQREKFPSAIICPSSSMDISYIMNKHFQSEIARSVGMNVPNDKVINKNESFLWVDFPCILKPIKSVCGGGKHDIKFASSYAELQSKISEELSNTIQIQRFIKKSMEFQLIGCSLDGGNIVIIPGFTRIIRQRDNTNTGYLKYSKIEELSFNLDNVKSLLKKFGYSGLFSMEFIRDINGTDYYLETNFRNDGNAYCVMSAGVNLPFIWSYYSVNRELPCQEKVTFDKPVYFMPDLEDIKLGIKSVGLIGWIKEFLSAKSHSVFDWNDMLPFIFQLYQRCCNRFHRAKNR